MTVSNSAQGRLSTGTIQVVLRLLGGLYFLFGAANALLAILEMYVFYLFSPGGRLHFEGFGFGTFMFANISAQIVGYSLLALVFITLGYGHWRLRKWASVLAQAALWCWVVLGLPLSAAAFFVYLTSKEPSVTAALVALVLLALLYLLAPWLMLRFYRGQSVQRALEAGGLDEEVTQPEQWRLPPVGALTLALLCMFYAAATWVLVFFHGAFPLFGWLLTAYQGIQAITFSVLGLLALAWGAFSQRRWAWWGALAYFAAFTLSCWLTLQRYPLGALLGEMRFAPLEMQALARPPVQDLHLTLLVGLPLLLTLGAVLAARRDFGG